MIIKKNIRILASLYPAITVASMITVQRSEKLIAKPHLNIGLANRNATVSPADSLCLYLYK